jgi:predicted alpha-1,2-mannosidase
LTLVAAVLVWGGCKGEGGEGTPDVGLPEAVTDARPEEPSDQGPSGDVPASEAETVPDPCSGLPTPCGLQPLVEPRIGSGELGYRLGAVFVGAAAPFGLAKPGPDTRHSEWGTWTVTHCSGYFYPDDLIDGFSHTHTHGTGVPDYGDLLVTTVRDLTAAKTAPGIPGYSNLFRHENEEVAPGYYRVKLEGTGTVVELTATTRAAVHRYTFPPGTNLAILFDPSYTLPGGSCDEAEIHVDPEENTVYGHKKSRGDLSGRFGGYTVYFWARLSRPFSKAGAFAPGELFPDQLDRTAQKAGAYLVFDTTQDPVVEIRMGISFVDLEGARKNVETEVGTRTFEEVYAETSAAWEQLLGSAVAEFDDPELAVIYYTSLYHTALWPTLFNDADGRYLGFDRQVHTADWGSYYTDFSLWDTFRTVHPLYVVLWPERQRDMLRSFVAMKEQGGCLPKWALAIGEANSMVGASADMVVADSYLKGIADFDVQSAFEGMVSLAENTHPELDCPGSNVMPAYIQHHYIPQDLHGASVSQTQEYAYADYCISRLAAALGDDERAALFEERGDYYANLWSAADGFFRARRADGTWWEPFDPVVWQDPYVEGDAWQYLFYAPHDPEGLAELMGGWQPLRERLAEFFQLSKDFWNDLVPSPYYFHGNEPDIHSAILFSYAGDPDLAAFWTSWIVEKNYSTLPTGLPGNDDAGTLSAWLVFTALGFYPTVCRNDYALFAPLARLATVDFAGEKLTVERQGEGQHVTAIRLDGKPLPAALATHEELSGASSLVFEMGDEAATWLPLGAGE